MSSAHKYVSKNPGKDYSEYLKEDEKKNGAIRRARLAAAVAARKARIAAGIDISLPGSKFSTPIKEIEEV